MKRSLAAPPEPFTLLPLVALLPSRGKVGKLESLRSALFARYEKVAQVIKNQATSGDQRLLAEEAMLRHVLDWLAMKT